MMYMKYGVLILVSMLSTKKLHTQTPEILNLKNFFGLKEDYDFQSQKQYEKIALDSQIIVFRKFHDNQFTINQEYIHFKGDTFLFREYAILKHQLTASGKVVPSICCNIIDTVAIFDVETYEEEIVIYKYWDWSKEGLWRFDNDDVYEYGNYKNNVKIGEWYVWDKNKKSAKYVYFDNFGIRLFEEPQNLLLLNNKERIIKEMLGSWRTDPKYKELHLFKEVEQVKYHTYSSLVFDKNVVDYRLRLMCGTGFDFKDFRKRSKGNWAIDDENVVSMQVYSFEGKKYKLTYLSRYEMSLLLVE